MQPLKLTGNNQPNQHAHNDIAVKNDTFWYYLTLLCFVIKIKPRMLYANHHN